MRVGLRVPFGFTLTSRRSLTFSSQTNKEAWNQKAHVFLSKLRWKKPVIRWHCSNLAGPTSHFPEGNSWSDTTIHCGRRQCFKTTTNLLWPKSSFCLLDECVRARVYLFRSFSGLYCCNKTTLQIWPNQYIICYPLDAIQWPCIVPLLCVRGKKQTKIATRLSNLLWMSEP